MNRSILIVMCDFIILSVMSLSTGVDQFGLPEGTVIVYEEQFNKLLERLSDTKKELRTAKEELKSSKEKAPPAKTGEDKELKSRLELSEKALRKITEQLSKTQEELVRAKAEDDKLAAAAAQVKARLAETEGRLASKDQELAKTAESLDSLAKRITESDKKLAVKAEEIAQKDKKLSDVELNLNDTRNKLAFSEGQVTTMQKELAEAKGRLDGVLGDLTNTKSRLQTAEARVLDMRKILASTETELTDTKGRLKNTSENLTQAKDKLAKTEVSLTDTEGRLTNTTQALGNTKEKLEELQKKLRTDVFKKYEETTLRLLFDICEKRWLNDYKNKKIWYLPQIMIGKNSYVMGEFEDLTGMQGDWVQHNRIYHLAYVLSRPDSNAFSGSTLEGPILSLGSDPRACLLQIPQGKATLPPISFGKLKERGVHNLYLFKKDKFGEGGCELGGRCSLDLNPGSNYMLVANSTRQRDIETNAEKGDFVLTKEGDFVGVIVEVRRSDDDKTEEARCFVFPDKFSVADSVQIPLTKKSGEEFFDGFQKTVTDISKGMRAKKPKPAPAVPQAPAAAPPQKQ